MSQERKYYNDIYYDCEYEEYLPPRHRSQSRHRWGFVPWALLLGALLFGCGFMLGNVKAAERKALHMQFPAAEPAVTPRVISVIPQEPPAVSSEAPQAVNDDWALTLVNWENPVPADYTIPELVELRNGQSFDRRGYPDLQRMMDDCRAAGLSPLISSSYRTEEFQTELFENKVAQYTAQGYDRTEAETLAAGWVARPGTSEHQLGLAVDIVDTGYQNLDGTQEETAVQEWLMEYCWEYGFILRYPADKTELTGVNYEPWHYRYVGSAAADIEEQGICLEEYLTQ